MAKPLKILHFADAHIDMANYGRRDPNSGLPLRVMDFLKSLDLIIDTAVQEKVDLVLFAGDAYKDRTPAPTFQREWGRRIMRLSKAGIPTLLLVGNHDLSPALGRAHAIEEFLTLEVPNIRVLDRPVFLTPEDLNLPLQLIALPWVSRSGMMAQLGLSAVDPTQVYKEMETRLTQIVQNWLEKAEPELPTILTAHASVQGALYGTERSVMLGNDLVLPRSLVCDPRLDYVALGHIHKPQNLNKDSYPAVIYPGSIERVDFGEAADDKFFMIVHLKKKHTRPEWRKLDCIRPFIDCSLILDDPENITSKILATLPSVENLSGAIVRLVLEYPRDWEALIDDRALHDHLKDAFEFHLVKRPQAGVRIRLPEDQSIGSLSHLELLGKYLDANHIEPKEGEALLKLAENIILEVE
jgi:DNA repair protein SbcD/Mre11